MKPPSNGHVPQHRPPHRVYGELGWADVMAFWRARWRLQLNRSRGRHSAH